MAKKCRWPTKKKLTKTGAYNSLAYLRSVERADPMLDAYKCGAHWHLGRRKGGLPGPYPMKVDQLWGTR